jgi:hypothetical protein
LVFKSSKNGTFVSQGKYIKDMLKKFDMSDSKAISTPMAKMAIWIVMQWQHGGSKVVLAYNWKPTLCDCIKTGCHV